MIVLFIVVIFNAIWIGVTESRVRNCERRIKRIEEEVNKLKKQTGSPYYFKTIKF